MSPSQAILKSYTRSVCKHHNVLARLLAFVFAASVASAANDKPEEDLPVVDRWAVENKDYGEIWGVESADMETRWGVITRHFEDSLGEKAAAKMPTIHRGFTFDTNELLDEEPPIDKKNKAAQNNKDKKAPSTQGQSKSGKKAHKPKVAAAKSGNNSQVVEQQASAKSANKGAGKKGSYKKYTLDINGKTRAYYVYLPAGYQKDKRYPVVIAFHGFQSDANGLRWLIKPDKWANKNQYIVVYPNAVKKSWNVGKGSGSANKNTDDIAFSKVLYKQLLAKHPVDSNRVYVMGFSNGAQMAALWVCQMAGKIAAAAMVAHTMNIPNCKPSHRTPIALIHGMQDKLAPYKGGGKHKLASHMESVAFFKKVNATMDKKVHVQSGKTYKCESWAHSDNATEVIDCKMYNNGHSWPGGVEFMVDVLGTTNKELNATEFLFRMFSKYRTLPPSR